MAEPRSIKLKDELTLHAPTLRDAVWHAPGPTTIRRGLRVWMVVGGAVVWGPRLAARDVVTGQHPTQNIAIGLGAGGGASPYGAVVWGEFALEPWSLAPGLNTVKA